MDYMGPFIFNAVRFALGALILLPFIFYRKLKGKSRPTKSRKELVLGGVIAGAAIFFGASFQQMGMVYTTAGKAGFITGLYVVLVPMLGMMFKMRSGRSTWIGAVLAVIGLYLLSVTGVFTVNKGDVFVFVSAFFWASHVLFIGWFIKNVDSFKLAFIQFSICSLLSFITAFSIETVSFSGLVDGLIPILYGGLLSVGIAYTLQLVGQRGANSAHAAIIMSLEAVFAVVGGILILGEILTTRGLIGCVLMLTGMIISTSNSNQS